MKRSKFQISAALRRDFSITSRVQPTLLRIIRTANIIERQKFLECVKLKCNEGNR